MSAIEPAGEKIVRNLQRAVERLHDDIARVELWAHALDGFSKPVPDYDHGQTRFDLPAQDTTPPQGREGGPQADSKTASKIGSPRWNPARGPAGQR